MMTVWMIWVRGDDYTWLAAAWDDDSTAENNKGWQEEVQRVRDLCHKEGYEYRIQRVSVPKVHDLFDIPKVEALDQTEPDKRPTYTRMAHALESIALHGKTPNHPCNAIVDGDCVDMMRETARAALSIPTEKVDK